jgi:hypothetical protein
MGSRTCSTLWTNGLTESSSTRISSRIVGSPNVWGCSAMVFGCCLSTGIRTTMGIYARFIVVTSFYNGVDSAIDSMSLLLIRPLDPQAPSKWSCKIPLTQIRQSSNPSRLRDAKWIVDCFYGELEHYFSRNELQSRIVLQCPSSTSSSLIVDIPGKIRLLLFLVQSDEL